MKDLVDSFLNHLVVEKGFSTNTLDAYRNDLHQFVNFVQTRPSASKDGWGQVDLDTLTSYVSDLRGRKSYRDTTTARKVAALKSFFNFLVEEEVVDHDPTELLTAPRVGRSLPKYLTEEQVERLLNEAAKEQSPEGKRDYAMLELLYATGLRVSELVSLNVEDVNLSDGYVRCLGKGSKERISYMYPRAVQAVKTYIQDARRLLLSRNGSTDRSGGVGPKEQKAVFINQRGDRLTRQWVWTVLRSCAKRASLNVPSTPHILRHSFATHMLRGGASLRHVQELLGHSSITTTQVYTHLTTDHVRKEFDRSHPRT